MTRDVRSRLIDCFGSVFAELSIAEVEAATSASMEKWDSISTAILIAVVEEEFVIEVGLDDLDQFVSFESILNFLEQLPRDWA